MPVLIETIPQKDNHGGPDNSEEGLSGYTAIPPSSVGIDHRRNDERNRIHP
ncbi:MAG: hypothetical protein OXL41_05880 [Nitrospinae bacterium]|nr:hypothetical protein [Nitrospinota bacterium]